MSDQGIIHFIQIILPLKGQFERDLYGLTKMMTVASLTI
jgi:hypothetical protein